MQALFCDWLSINQVHPNGCPVFHAGRVLSVDIDGEVTWEVAQRVVERGSHDTSIRISSDGHRVTLDGNIGRFNRPDNVFGRSVADCVKIANELLISKGLPPFTDTKGMEVSTKNGSAYAPTGAVISRIDLTQNYATGSASNASMYIRHLQGFKSGKFEPLPYRTTGVSWGEGSKWLYAKVYDKAADYLRHRSVDSASHDAELYAFLRDSGIVRHEVTLKSRWLKQNGLWRFSLWDDAMQDVVYARFADVVRASANVDEFLEIPGRAGELAVAWRDGADLKKRLSKVTFYKYRNQLLEFGIDISVQANVRRLATRVEIIKVSPASVPEWYSLRLVA